MHRSRSDPTDIDLTRMAGATRPLWLAPKRQQGHGRTLIASLAILSVMVACTLMLLALPIIAVP